MKPQVPIELSDLVAEARSDGPSPEALSRLADEASARAAAAPVTSRSVGRLASRLGAAAVVSAAAFGILTAAGGFDTSSDSEPAPSATHAPVTVEQPTAAPVVDDSTNVVPAVPTIDVRSLPAPQARKNATDDDKGPAAPADDASEGALLRRAYAATTTAPRQALALTVEHARRFPTGVLAEEREVIAIEALAQLGRDDEARSRASAFFAAHPGSAYRLRIDDALRKSAPAPSPRESHDP